MMHPISGEPVHLPDVELQVRDRAAADAASLVLEALAIPHAIVPLEAGFAVATDAAFAARAVMALDADERERAEASVSAPAPPDLGRSYVGLTAGIALMALLSLKNAVAIEPS